MSRTVAISETGPFLGQHSALDSGDVPDGGSRYQLNVHNVPGNPLAVKTRRGLRCLVNDADRLAAQEWVASTVHASGTFVYYGGETYRANATTPGSSTFAAEVSYWDRIPSVGLHVNTAHTTVPGVLVQGVRSNGETPLLKFLAPRDVYTYPDGFAVIEPQPGATPIANQTAEYAYLSVVIPEAKGNSDAFSRAGSSTTGTIHNWVMQVDINLRSGAADGERLTRAMEHAHTSGAFQSMRNCWVVKGPDNFCYIFWWARRTGEGDPGDTNYFNGGSEIAIWGAEGPITSLNYVYMNRGYVGRGLDQQLADKFYRTPIAATIDAAGQLVIVGDHHQSMRWWYNNQSVEPAGNRRTASGGWSSDLVWRFPTAQLSAPTTSGGGFVLLGRLSTACNIRPKPNSDTACTRDSGSPHLFGLPANRFLLCTTTRPLASQTQSPQWYGIAVSLWEWSGTVPQQIAVWHTTTSLTNATTSAASEGMDAWSVCRCAPVGTSKVVVARGTSGADLHDFATGQTLTMALGSNSVTGVAVNRTLGHIYLWDDTAKRIVVYSRDGIATGTEYDSGDYAFLAYDFHGWFLSADEKFLWVLMYQSVDDGGSVGFGNKLVGIPVGVPDWVTLTIYAPGDEAQESGLFYVCQTPHTAGTFATDLAAAKWVVKTNVQVLDWTRSINIDRHYGATTGAPLDDAEPFLYASGDPTGATYRNVTIGATA